jgi:hypothetical protein
MFPVAMSPNISSVLSSGSIKDLYTLDNGDGDELVFLIMDTGVITAVIFDTSLNYRGYIVHDGSTIILNDGPGFVDFNNDFIVGDEVLERDGTDSAYSYGYLSGDSEYSVSRYTASTSVNYYLYIDDNYTGNLNFFDTSWTSYYSFTLTNFYPSIKHSNLDTEYFDLYDQSNNKIYDYKMDDLFTAGPTAVYDTITLDNTNLSEWITRCDEGYFVSNYSGEMFLFDFDGDQSVYIDTDNSYSELVCTIDYDSDYYYYIDQNDGYIIKEKLPSW